MKWKLGLAAIALTVASAGFAVANEDIISMRKDVMKANGAAAKVVFGMAKGDIPFDATVAAAALDLIAANSTQFTAMFPAGSETGDTKAAEAIWSDPSGFQAAGKATADAAAAAAAAAADGQQAMGAALGAVGAGCGTCHEGYRTGG